jgi:hypothetical protein
MTTMARWLPLLAIACTGKVEEDDSQPTGDDSSTPTDDTDDSGTNDDSGKVTKGDRWDGEYTGGWNLVFDWVGKIPESGHCNGDAVVTVAGKDIAVDVTTNECKGVGFDFYGPKPKATIANGDIQLDPGFPSNQGTADFTLVGTKETCAFEFDWTFSDITNHPVQVTAEYTLNSDSEFKKFYCGGAGYTFNLQAQIPEKD